MNLENGSAERVPVSQVHITTDTLKIKSLKFSLGSKSCP